MLETVYIAVVISNLRSKGIEDCVLEMQGWW